MGRSYNNYQYVDQIFIVKNLSFAYRENNYKFIYFLKYLLIKTTLSWNMFWKMYCKYVLSCRVYSGLCFKDLYAPL